MSSKLFVIHGAPELTQEIHSSLVLGLKETTKQRERLETVLETRSKNLGLMGFFRLRVLHREFYEKENKAIRLLVVSARCASQSLKKWKVKLKRKR